MQIECGFMIASELGESGFGDSPEVFNTIDMVGIMRKFILYMLDSMMLFVTKIDQAVIGLESIGINHSIRCYLIPDDGQ